MSIELTNSGEAKADQINLGLSSDGSSAVSNSPLIIESLDGSESVTDTFMITAASISDVEEFGAVIESAIDANSLQNDLVTISPATDDSESVNIELPGEIDIT